MAFEAVYLNGEVSLELYPQGSLIECIRAYAVRIPVFFSPYWCFYCSRGRVVSQTGVKIPGVKKEKREFDGPKSVMDTATPGDVAFIRAWKVDVVENCVFRFAQNNFNTTIAKNVKLIIVEADKIVLVGSFDSDGSTIHIPDIYADCVKAY
ncbi:hypothetical protein JVU11DRAFT_7906 [Chiua virens]|nr:hypothetical protein JVU11DRAFT_7906 [Chiua virens]